MSFVATSSATATVNNSGKTSAFTFVVPAGYVIKHVFVTNNTANAVTGGLKFGTTVGGVDVVVALTVGASAFTTALDAALLKRRFSKTVDQTVYIDAVVAWNSANVDVDVILGKI